MCCFLQLVKPDAFGGNMIRALVLNKEIKCENICQEVQKLVNDHNRDHGNAEDTVLVMEIKKIVRGLATRM